MSEPTYTEAEIREAMAVFYRISDGDEIRPDHLIYHLKRPKHGFAEGQVLLCRGDYRTYYRYFPCLNTDNLRGLTLTELGPHVKALRDAVGDVDKYPVDYARKLLRDALAEFDKAVGESND